MKIGILLSNPNHHLELTDCVAIKLRDLGHEVKYISICRLRRLPDPVEKIQSMGLQLAVLPIQLKNAKPSTGAQALGGSNSIKRKVLQWLAWQMLLRPFLKREAARLNAVLLMNDTAFPYNFIISHLQSRSIKTFLLQEGIRFDLPNEKDLTTYGSTADYVFSWGEQSANLFRLRRQGRENTVCVTGSPRFDKQRELYSHFDKGKKVLGIFTNPIDDQGFLTTDSKHELVIALVSQIVDQARRMNIQVELKPHPREDIERYRADLKPLGVTVLSCSIHEAIERAGAGIVFASTVGLELIAANRPIAQCSLPHHGFVFDYVSSGSAQPIQVGLPFDIVQIFNQSPSLNYLNSHLEEGNSCERTVNMLLHLV